MECNNFSPKKCILVMMWPMMACVIINIRSVPNPNASELTFTVSMNALLFAKSEDSNMHVPITMKVKLIYGVSVANKNF